MKVLVEKLKPLGNILISGNSHHPGIGIPGIRIWPVDLLHCLYQDINEGKVKFDFLFDKDFYMARNAVGDSCKEIPYIWWYPQYTFVITKLRN